MPTDQAPRSQQYTRPSTSGIGINAVEAASLYREKPREDRYSYEQADRILPYEDTGCCTD